MGVVYTVSPSWIPLPFVEAIAMALLPAPERHLGARSALRGCPAWRPTLPIVPNLLNGGKISVDERCSSRPQPHSDRGRSRGARISRTDTKGPIEGLA